MKTAAIAERRTCCAGTLDETDQHVQLALLRLLARGEPVEPARLADDSGLEPASVTFLVTTYGVISAWPGLPSPSRPVRVPNCEVKPEAEVR